jgi:hypothetical protein
MDDRHFKIHQKNWKKRGVSLCHLVVYFKEKEELLKLEYFMMQKYNLQKILHEKTKILQDIYNFIINLKFQHKPKYHISKILISK